MSNDQITVGLLAIMVLKEVIGLVFHNHKKGNDALHENTLAVTELKVEIRHLKEIVSIIPKLKSDIDAAHDKIRNNSGGVRA